MGGLLLEQTGAGRQGGSPGLGLQDGAKNKERRQAGRKGRIPGSGAGRARAGSRADGKKRAEFQEWGSGGGQKI